VFLRQVDAADRQFDRKDRAVLAHRLELAGPAENLRDLRLPIAREIIVMLGAMRLGHENRHVLADHLLGLPPEDPLNRLARRENDAVGIDRHHGIKRRVEHRFVAGGQFLERELAGVAPRREQQIVPRPFARVRAAFGYRLAMLHG